VVLAVALGVLIAFILGCGPKPPCPVPMSEVKSAQDQTAAAEDALSKVQTEKAGLEKDLAQKQASLDSLKGKPAELEKKLDNLKKGSGR
jgi:peptidoglycan hydrolase CwlO-like protein